MSYDVVTHTITDDLYRALLYNMAKVRRFEEKLVDFYQEKLVHGTLHLCIGEEAAVVGSTAALKKDDYIFTTHRCHGECIGKGADIRSMFAEILGREGGCNEGVGGSMHITEPELGIVGSNGGVGAGVPIALGAALSIKLKKEQDRVAVCFFGDGAANQGAVLESMNLAGAWKLPIIFVLIENRFAVSTPPEKSAANPDYVTRGLPFRLKPFDVDGDDVLKVLYTMAKAREYVLNEGGPCLIVEHTYRVSGHSRSDLNRYRSISEIEYHRENSPIKAYSEYLIREGFCSEDEIFEIIDGAHRDVAEAADHALAQPPVVRSAAELEQSVYA